MMLNRSALRRVAVVATVGLWFGSRAEPLLGELHDGEVHHESLTEAEWHHIAAPREHLLEDDPVGPSSHGDPAHHEHGTGADHCTHVHGPILPCASHTATLVDVVTLPETRLQAPPPPFFPRLHSPPPRA